MTSRRLAIAYAVSSVVVLSVAAAVIVMPIEAQQRDSRPSASAPAATPDRGTAVVSGSIVDARTGQAMTRAIVTLHGPGVPSTRSVVSNDQGRFQFERLPSGQYTLVATKAAYLESAYGATRPGRPGTALQLTDTQRMDVTIAITRGAVLEGVIRDETGAPVPRVSVYAVDPRNPGTLSSGGMFGGRQQRRVTTDDRGVYRMFGLPPGEYVIGSTFEPAGEGEIARRTVSEVDAILAALAQSRGRGAAPASPTPAPPAVGYAPTFYPGVSTFTDALRIRLAAAEERSGVDFTLAPVRTTTIEGTIARHDGQTSPIQLSIVSDGPMVFGATSRPILSLPPGADGRFRYTSVPPGRYRILARAEPAGASAGPVVMSGGGISIGGRGGPLPPGVSSSARERSFAAAEVIVSGQDVVATSLVLQPGATVEGRIAFDATTDPPEDVTSVRVTIGTGRGGSMSSFRDGTQIGDAIFGVPAATVRDDGSFVASGVPPGSYQLRSTIPSDSDGQWWLRSAVLDGRDLLDEPLEIGTIGRSGIVLTYTDRRNELSGTFQTASGLPATDYFVVVFPADRVLWREGSRRFGATRPATDGRFSLTGLPAGAYRMAALTDFEPADFSDHVYLETLAAQSIPIAVRDGERTVQDIRMAQ